MATKEDVKVIDERLSDYIESHEKLHNKDDKRMDQMFEMIQAIYNAEMNRNK